MSDLLADLETREAALRAKASGGPRFSEFGFWGFRALCMNVETGDTPKPTNGPKLKSLTLNYTLQPSTVVFSRAFTSLLMGTEEYFGCRKNPPLLKPTSP